MDNNSIKIKVISILRHEDIEIHAIDLDPETGTVEVLVM